MRTMRVVGKGIWFDERRQGRGSWWCTARLHSPQSQREREGQGTRSGRKMLVAFCTWCKSVVFLAVG